MTTTTVETEDIAGQVTSVLRGLLGDNSTIDTEPFQDDRVLVVAVSPQFNDMTPKQRQRMVWGPVRKALGPRARRVALVLTYGTHELM